MRNNRIILTYLHLLKSSRIKSFDEITIDDFPTKYKYNKFAIYIEKGKQKPLK